VSKWETNQSIPDFDKIIPLCELFEISTEELLTGKTKEREENDI
jgi:transcriptional regulator with XRE-family HTH domain